MKLTTKTVSLVAAFFALFATGCTNANEPATLTGSYTATTFTMTPTGQSTINMLTQGATLSLTIAADNTTSGSLFEPASASLTGAAVQASMTGTVIQAGVKVNFNQSADTFVRDLNWLVVGSTLQVTSQAGNGATYTVILTRQ